MADKEKTFEAVRSKELSRRGDERFVIVDKESGKVLDNAQGYGYRSRQKAYAAYTYKTGQGSKARPERAAAEKWLKAHRGFGETLDTYAFEIAKGSWGPEDDVDTKLVRDTLHSYGFKESELGFTAYDLLKAWEKG